MVCDIYVAPHIAFGSVYVAAHIASRIASHIACDPYVFAPHIAPYISFGSLYVVCAPHIAFHIVCCSCGSCGSSYVACNPHIAPVDVVAVYIASGSPYIDESSIYDSGFIASTHLVSSFVIVGSMYSKFLTKKL